MRTGDDDEMRIVMAERHAAWKLTMAERERCAKIVEEYGCHQNDCAPMLAAKIRSGE